MKDETPNLRENSYNGSVDAADMDLRMFDHKLKRSCRQPPPPSPGSLDNWKCIISLHRRTFPNLPQPLTHHRRRFLASFRRFSRIEGGNNQVIKTRLIIITIEFSHLLDHNAIYPTYPMLNVYTRETLSRAKRGFDMHRLVFRQCRERERVVEKAHC